VTYQTSILLEVFSSLGEGKSYLGMGFALICFQRLSLPNVATLQCRWCDNRYTRGSSTSVLSY